MNRPDVAFLGFKMDTVVTQVAAFATPVLADDIAALSPERRAAITCAVTSAVNGASGELLDLLPNLSHIVSAGAGLDRFDFDDLRARGITLNDTGHLVSSDTAEMAVMLLLAMARDVVRADDHVRSGRWADGHFGYRIRVAGKTAGIVGLGRIGRLIAERLTGLGLDVAYHTRAPRPDAPWPHVGNLEELAARSDFLVAAVPGGAATRNMFDAGVLRALGPRGYFVNISRGTVVDEEALISALTEGTIAGAALDVFENEPRPDPRFAKLSNVTLTPHVAAITEDYAAELAADIARQVVAHLEISLPQA
ncbi:NAD(P)-dependent oxidoreductase [Sulfitobacter porphyrae]|uniref:NAD(P)-dependent oxidoreductase n=1 Tax=Sulfitobacter porphyrae TaxID=1246864 RepID=A0ABW2B7X4_9RHOB|nr:dihydrofolate reductase [Sulfitobacter porphyrae]